MFIPFIIAMAINALSLLGLVQPLHGHYECIGDQGCHLVEDPA